MQGDLPQGHNPIQDHFTVFYRSMKYFEVIEDRDFVLEKYGRIFSISRLSDLSEKDFKRFLSPHNNRRWTGLERNGGRATKDMDLLRRGLSVLLDERRPISTRFTETLNSLPGVGTAIATAILIVAYPDKYGVWNTKSETALKHFGRWPDTLDSGMTKGDQYTQVNVALQRLGDELEADLWTVDAFWGWLYDKGVISDE